MREIIRPPVAVGWDRLPELIRLGSAYQRLEVGVVPTLHDLTRFHREEANFPTEAVEHLIEGQRVRGMDGPRRLPVLVVVALAIVVAEEHAGV